MIAVLCDLIVDMYEILNLELLGKARSLADENNEKVMAVAIGNDTDDSREKLLHIRADYILYINVEAHYTYWSVSKAVKQYLEKYAPALVLFAATSFYKSVAASVAVSCGAGLTADCIDINTDAVYKYKFTRAAMGASVIAEIVCINTEIRLCTIKQNVFKKYIEPIRKAKDLKYETFAFTPAQNIKINEISRSALEIKEEALTKAKFIIGIGRGVGVSDLAKVQEIAGLLKAELGGTRVLVENGILPKSKQIGQSGLTISPNIYLALGISGASQHIVGIQNSKKIIAVNQDENSPIFEYADYAIVADTHDVINSLYQKLSIRNL